MQLLTQSVLATINVYTEIPDVTSLTIDKDNFCANDGETVTLTAFTSSPVGTSSLLI